MLQAQQIDGGSRLPVGLPSPDADPATSGSCGFTMAVLVAMAYSHQGKRSSLKGEFVRDGFGDSIRTG
jgi:hypothetical protein